MKEPEAAPIRPLSDPPMRDDDVPLDLRRELMACATANGRISYYWLCAVYRAGREAVGAVEDPARPQPQIDREKAQTLLRTWVAEDAETVETSADLQWAYERLRDARQVDGVGESFRNCVEQAARLIEHPADSPALRALRSAVQQYQEARTHGGPAVWFYHRSDDLKHNVIDAACVYIASLPPPQLGFNLEEKDDQSRLPSDATTRTDRIHAESATGDKSSRWQCVPQCPEFGYGNKRPGNLHHRECGYVDATSTDGEP